MPATELKTPSTISPYANKIHLQLARQFNFFSVLKPTIGLLADRLESDHKQ
jgi:hypothetical protein